MQVYQKNERLSTQLTIINLKYLRNLNATKISGLQQTYIQKNMENKILL